MLSHTSAGDFIRLPNEQVLYSSPPRVQMSLDSLQQYPGHGPWSLCCSSGRIHLTNKRVCLYTADECNDTADANDRLSTSPHHLYHHRRPVQHPRPLPHEPQTHSTPTPIHHLTQPPPVHPQHPRQQPSTPSPPLTAGSKTPTSPVHGSVLMHGPASARPFHLAAYRLTCLQWK